MLYPLGDWPYYQYNVLLCPLYYFFWFKVCFVWYQHSYASLLSFSWNIFFHSLTPILCMFLCIKWISCVQQIDIIEKNLANLNFYFDFNLFTFKLITDSGGFTVAILLFSVCLLYPSFFLLLPSFVFCWFLCSDCYFNFGYHWNDIEHLKIIGFYFNVLTT